VVDTTIFGYDGLRQAPLNRNGQSMQRAALQAVESLLS